MSDRIIFPEETKQNNNKNIQTPSCMKNVQNIDKNAKDLTPSESALASKQLINKSFIELSFPKRLKQRVDPPISGQKFCVFTFVPSKDAIPDKDGVFGYSKIRYVSGTEDEAYSFAENIVRTFDSVNENLVGYVGKDFPITLSNDYCATTKEIDIRMGMDAAAKHNFQKQKEADDKEVREIQERQRKLVSEKNNEKDTENGSQPEDLDYYLTLIVKLANVEVAFDKLETQKQEYEKLFKTTKENIETLNTKFPEYKKQYMEKYKQSLETCGANPADNPLIKKMEKYTL